MAASTASQLSGNRSMLSVLTRNTGEQTVPVRDELKICKKKKEKTNIGVAGVADSCNMWLRLSPPILLLSLNLHPPPLPHVRNSAKCPSYAILVLILLKKRFNSRIFLRFKIMIVLSQLSTLTNQQKPLNGGIVSWYIGAFS